MTFEINDATKEVESIVMTYIKGVYSIELYIKGFDIYGALFDDKVFFDRYQDNQVKDKEITTFVTGLFFIKK